MNFTPFPKISRLSRDMVVTEKLDGTNASIFISRIRRSDQDSLPPEGDGGVARQFQPDSSVLVMQVGSRTRWLDTSSAGDNYGFAKWAVANADELFKLGEGAHFGEWWGLGVQRGYGLTEKRFSLFNVGRWYDPRDCEGEDIVDRTPAPSCCHVVPVLLRGPFSTATVDRAVEILRLRGSHAAPGFLKPEGVIVYHTAAGLMFKKTLERDEAPKGAAA